MASWDATLEENVNLTVRASLVLWQVEESSDQTEETSGTPDVTAFTTEITALEYVLVAEFVQLGRKIELTVGLSM